MQAEARSDGKVTIGVLYGFRALMVLAVVNYHIWQQGWLPQYIHLFGSTVDLDFITRSSYLFVDGMMLLSGFLLYLPYARETVYGTPVPGTARFYWNRLSRIVPSYLFSVLVLLFAIALPSGAYRDAASQNVDLLTHLTFTFTFFRDTYLFTPLNGVLWTVAIEMQFYLIFPLLLRFMRRKPVLTLCGMGLLGVLFRVLVARTASDLSMWVNQLPSFLDVYALGMLGAMLYVRLTKRLTAAPRHSWLTKGVAFVAPVLFAAGCWLVLAILRLQSDNGLAGHDQLRLSQWLLRLPLALTLLLMMLSAALMPHWLQKPLDNRLMRFMATISFNLYIWHQVISVLVAKNLFPSTLHIDLPLQQAFTMLCLAVSTLVAMAVTYGLEQPIAKRMAALAQKYQQNKETQHHERPKDTSAVPSVDPLLVRVDEGAEGTH